MKTIQKTVPPKLFLAFKRHLTLTDFPNVVSTLVPMLYQEAKTMGLALTGPVEFLYDGCDGNPTTPFDFHIALPIAEKIGDPIQASYLETETFECLSGDYHGSMAGIYGAWGDLMQAASEANLSFTEHGREIYHTWVDSDSDDNHTELQIGLQKTITTLSESL